MFQANATLGEGPIWDPRSQNIYWIDIRRSRISRYNIKAGRQTGVWITAHRPGCIGLTLDENRLVVAAGNRVEILDLTTGRTEEIARLPIEASRFRANDGRVDRMGRFWVGTMIDDVHAPETFCDGALFRVDPDGSVFKVEDTLELPNGIGWNEDDTILYFNDTTTLKTFCFDFNSAAGTLSNRRVFYDHSGGEGYPDGLSVDTEGCVWSAQWDGWNIRKISPDGDLLEQFAMPVRRPSSAAFFGENLDQLVITSATVDFVTNDYLKSPDAGSLFSMRTDTTGTQENFFAL